MENKSSTKNRVVIAGGTGFLGLNLARHLTEKGHEVVLISRNAPHQAGPWLHAKWNGRSVGDWAAHLEGAAWRRRGAHGHRAFDIDWRIDEV